MNYGQAKDIIQHARDFNHRVSEFYQKLSEHAEKPRVKLLLEYLARHESHLERALNDYSDSMTQEAMNTWYQIAQDQCTFQPLDEMEYPSDMSVSDVFRIGAKLDECLVESYKAVANTATSKEVRDIFQNLLDMEEQEKHRRARMELELGEY